MLLEDRVCIITGAASKRGIGRATASLFARNGARCIILDLNSDECESTAQELGSSHRGYACDVSEKIRCREIVDKVVDEFGQVDVLVNSAGITQPLKIQEIRPEDYDKIMDVHLRGSLYMSQAIIPYLRKRKSGSIICISSVSGQRGGGIFGGPHYCAAKAGILGLVKAMARELAPEGIRVNSIAPGLIDTDITGGLLTDELKEKIVKDIPLGRIGKADDVAAACLFLASDFSSYITGAVIDVNGGMHIY